MVQWMHCVYELLDRVSLESVALGWHCCLELSTLLPVSIHCKILVKSCVFLSVSVDLFPV